MPDDASFTSDKTLRVGETMFHFEHPLFHVMPGHLGIEKVQSLLEEYLTMWDELRPRRVVELGIRTGGSTAMLFELGGLERLVAIELQPNPVQALDRHIAARGAQDIVHPMYGVNQADRERLARIMVDEFGGESIDLVIDDASHLYHESRVSFDVLYPRLRPGGLYLLEDWRCQHMIANSLTTALETSDEVRREVERRMTEEGWTGPATPMSRLVVELLIARAISGDIVAEMTVGPHWVAVRRGPAELDVEGFNLDDHAPDHTHLLASIR